MTATLDPNTLYYTTFLLAVFFTWQSTQFPMRNEQGPKNRAGDVFAHVRAVLYPFLASACWWLVAALVEASGTDGSFLLYIFFVLMIFVEALLFVYGLWAFLGKMLEEGLPDMGLREP